jgi:hypothetical protein
MKVYLESGCGNQFNNKATPELRLGALSEHKAK